ncbi:MAG: hypothetical protein QM487_06825 [Candidatus Marithrix sp.]
MRMIRFLTVLLLSFNLHALEFQPRGDTLYIWGDYVEDDYDAFLEIMELNYISTVELGESEGGLISESFAIGRYIKENGIVTIIEDGVDCSSSCAMVWAAGKDRRIMGTGKAHFHAPYVPTDMVMEMIDTKCLEEFLEEDDTVDTCKAYTDEQVIDGVRWMTRDAIRKGVEYMIEVGAPNEWTIKMLDQDPASFFTVTNKNMEVSKNAKLYKLSSTAR